MAKKKDINDVTDEISLIMREVVEATENNMLVEIASTLNKHADKVSSISDYRLKQAGENKALRKRLSLIAKQSELQQINIAKNIGTFAGINTAPLEAEIKKGTQIVLKSAEETKNDTLKKIYRLNKFNTSAQFVPNLRESIIKQTELGIDKGLPVTFKNGRKVGYREYMEMAVRTGIQQEIGEQQIEIAKQANIVFFVCDEYADCADDHADYQGKIYYNADYTNFNLTDQAKQMIANAIKAKQFLSVQEVRDGEPYLTTRPNCRHRFIPISIDEAVGEDLARVKQSVDSIRGNYRPENYEALQQQRALERNIRKTKAKMQAIQELQKANPDDATYQREIEKLRGLISKYQGKTRKLLSDFPSLSREPRRETRKILIKDLGVKYNLKNMKNEPPTPVTNNPPPAPPMSDANAQKQMNETVASHYAMPEEKKVYVKKAYEVDWKAPNANMIKGQEAKSTYDNWRSRFENIDNEPETDDGRKITAYFFKEIDNVVEPTFDVTLSKDRGFYNPFGNYVSVQSIQGENNRPPQTSETMWKNIVNRHALTYTHELGHAIDYNLKKRFALNKAGGGVSGAGTTRPLAAIYRDLTGNSIREGTSYFDLVELSEEEVQKVVDAVESSGQYDKEQVDMLKNAITFNRTIEKAQIVRIGGRISKEKVQKWEENTVLQSNAFQEIKKITEEEQKEIDKVRSGTDWEKINNQQINVIGKTSGLNKEKEKLTREVSENMDLYFDKKSITEEEYDRRQNILNEKISKINNEQDELQQKYVELTNKQREINIQLRPQINIIEAKYNDIRLGQTQIQDFFDALSGGRSWEAQNVITHGHGQDYYKDQDSRNVEIFTHLVTLRMHSPRLYNALKKDYPEIFAAHEKILADAIPVVEREKNKQVKSFQAFKKRLGEK